MLENTSVKWQQSKASYKLPPKADFNPLRGKSMITKNIFIQ